MGNSNSARVITLTNEDPTSVIKVSEGVVQRMKGGSYRKSGVEEDTLKPADVSSSTVIEQQPLFTGEPLTTTLQVKREKEAVLRNNDVYWQQRIADIQENYKKINRKMEEEYETAVKEVETSFKKASNAIKEYPCQDFKAEVVKCYQEHSKQPLLCSKEVQTFQKCVQQTMIGLVENRS
ncbi:MICOS complex subunit MIC19-like [Anabrus simplex]|uniref:MICOS complex subunit MIC19-like n=1 Tax=Anabrus simplex TaxID=316456 RepID=UPI0034DD3435